MVSSSSSSSSAPSSSVERWRRGGGPAAARHRLGTAASSARRPGGGAGGSVWHKLPAGPGGAGWVEQQKRGNCFSCNPRDITLQGGWEVVLGGTGGLVTSQRWKPAGITRWVSYLVLLTLKSGTWNFQWASWWQRSHNTRRPCPLDFMSFWDIMTKKKQKPWKQYHRRQ